jgi:hypothetical protein
MGSGNSYSISYDSFDRGDGPHASLAVSGGDVYVACSYGDKDLGKRLAKVWKNGEELYSLTDGQCDVEVMSVFVSGDNVYVAGTVFYERRSDWKAIVWKNGEELYCFSSRMGDRAYGDCIFVSGNDVYVAWTDFGKKNGRENIANVWKNGEELFSQKDCSINAMHVFGEDVYYAGYKKKKRSEKKIAKVWKNGSELYTLGDGKTDAEGLAIFVNNLPANDK